MEAQGNHERYAATHDLRNPAYIHDDDTDTVYKYNDLYNRVVFPDYSHHKSSSATSHERDDKKLSKKASSRLVRVSLGAVILAISLVIVCAVVIPIMTAVGKDDVMYPDVLVVSGSGTKGQITLSNTTWKSAFKNSSSEEYKLLESQFIAEMDTTYRKSSLADVYNQTTVEQFRQGSVIVEFVVHLNGPTPSAKQILVGDDTQQVQEEVEMATASDILSVLNSETDDSSLGEFTVGEASVTVVISVIIEVQDGTSENQPPETEPPSVTCPDDITQNTDDESPAAIVTWEEPLAEDNSGVIDRIESQPESGSEFKIGETEVTVLAYDAAGNIGLCTFTVTVVDEEIPSVICPSNVTENVSKSEATRVVTLPPPEATDNSGEFYVDTTPVSGHAFPIGVTPMEVTVTDMSGNSVTCTFFINILDNERPVVTCPADIAVDTDPGQSTGSVTWSSPSATDNSGQGVSLKSDSKPGKYDIGQHSVTYNGEDGSGNTAQCSFNVTVTDNERPEVTCPADIAVDADPGQSTGSVSWLSPLAKDNSGKSVSLTTDSKPGNYAFGQHAVTYTAEDESGNTAQCSFNVTVTDNERPLVTCPVDVAVDTDPGQSTGSVTWSPPTATDNSGQSVSLTSDLKPGNYGIGQYVVTYTAEDESGNTGQCSFNVTVTDNERPVVTCPVDVAVDTDPGQSTGSVTWSSPTATDNSGQSVSLTSDLKPGNYGTGQYVVTYTGEDESGNTGQCSFNVTVIDYERPVVTCPADVAVDTDPGQSTGSVTWSPPTATDNSGQSVSLTSDLEPGNYGIGQYVVTYTGEDESGNTGQCSFIVSVTDNEPPVISCPSDIYNKTQTGEVKGYITWAILPPTDNSGGVVMHNTDYQPGEFPIGSYTVNTTATDAYGNTAWCTFMFVVEPLCHPEFCLNEGNCSFSPLDNAYLCQCPEGFLGKNCELESIFVNSFYVFNSPNFPFNYPNNFLHTWFFSTDPGSQLLITFNVISTEDDYDYIFVGEGSNISAISNFLLRWSGIGSPNELRILSSESIIWVTFYSDGIVTYNGFEATVEVTNMTREELNCGTEFDCENGVCLPQCKVCDEMSECGNNADEAIGNCIGSCSSSQFSCSDGKCIPGCWRCDGYSDCSEGEDEFWCNGTDSCSPSEFSCYDGSCIPGYWQCDGYFDCDGGEDELSCHDSCSPSEFSCYDGSCIPGYWQCNGYFDCDGGEDELSCHEFIFVNSSYIFNSTNYPSNYPNNLQYTWYFSTDPGSQLLITFIDISTEDGYDYIYVGEGSNISVIGDLLLRWSGMRLANELRVLSSENIIWVTFESDGIITDKGFAATVEVTNMTREELNCATEFDCENGVCLPQSRVCDGDRECGNNADEKNGTCRECALGDLMCYDSIRCIQSNQVCNEIRECPSKDDEINCHPNCSAEDITLMSNQSTLVQSTNYPGFYFPNMECAWIVAAPENHSIIVRTGFLEIGEKDSITIGRGQNALNTSNIIRVIRNNELRDIAVDERFAWIRFSSGSGEVTTKGFLLDVVALRQRDFEKETFQCFSGQSIIKSEVCDGVNDCPDFADEDECPPCVDVLQTECHPLLPYQQTIFPHPLAVSLDEASSHISNLSFLTGCHPSINVLLCSVLYPDCPHTGPVTRLCRSFCLNVTNSCKALYEEMMFSPWLINCDNYDDNLPVGDDGFCNGGEDDVFDTGICGTRPTGPIRGRIVGGTEASFGDWPWIASLRDEFGDHQCGATLITERWAITAAHCIGHVSSAIFGDLYLSTPSTYHHETKFTINTHPQYNSFTYENDIALLELHKPVNFSDYVRPSCLSTLKNETDVYRRCYIVGWGVQEAGTLPNRLQEALTHLFTAEECLNYLPSDYIEDVMLCAGYDKGGIDTCQGDSGGPLVCEGHDGRWHLVGVTSFGYGCALPELPGVYTRISQQIDFIKSLVG